VVRFAQEIPAEAMLSYMGKLRLCRMQAGEKVDASVDANAMQTAASANEPAAKGISAT
jgi:hypothetical protein